MKKMTVTIPGSDPISFPLDEPQPLSTLYPITQGRILAVGEVKNLSVLNGRLFFTLNGSDCELATESGSTDFIRNGSRVRIDFKQMTIRVIHY